MAKSITFTFNDNQEALDLLDAVCVKWQYDVNKLEDETKGQFLRRVTLQWWMDEATQGEVRQTFSTIQARWGNLDTETSEA